MALQQRSAGAGLTCSPDFTPVVHNWHTVKHKIWQRRPRTVEQLRTGQLVSSTPRYLVTVVKRKRVSYTVVNMVLAQLFWDMLLLSHSRWVNHFNSFSSAFLFNKGFPFLRNPVNSSVRFSVNTEIYCLPNGQKSSYFVVFDVMKSCDTI